MDQIGESQQKLLLLYLFDLATYIDSILILPFNVELNGFFIQKNILNFRTQWCFQIEKVFTQSIVLLF